MEPRHVLLGIRLRWAEQILCGSKTIEVRRGCRRWRPGDWLWLYAVAPRRAVVGVVLVAGVDVVAALAGERGGYLARAALSRREYWRYVRGECDLVSMVGLCAPVRLAEPRALDALGLHVPQSAYYLDPAGARAEALDALLGDPAVVVQRPVLDALAARCRARWAALADRRDG